VIHAIDRWRPSRRALAPLVSIGQMPLLGRKGQGLLGLSPMAWRARHASDLIAADQSDLQHTDAYK
jgi:hypothetical protein